MALRSPQSSIAIQVGNQNVRKKPRLCRYVSLCVKPEVIPHFTPLFAIAGRRKAFARAVKLLHRPRFAEAVEDATWPQIREKCNYKGKPPTPGTLSL